MIVVWRRKLRGHRERAYMARLSRLHELLTTMWAAVAKTKGA